MPAGLAADRATGYRSWRLSFHAAIAGCWSRSAKPRKSSAAARRTAARIGPALGADSRIAEPRRQFARRQRAYRFALAGLVEMRGGAALVHSRHLPGELLEVGRRVGGDEQLGLVAVPRQRDIARGRAPMLGVIQVRLIA